MTDMKSHGYTEKFDLFGDRDPDDFQDDVSMSKPKRYRGKYRGTVVNNVDPLGQNRLIVRVTDTTGFFTTGWALPCVPFAGPLMGMYIVPPPIGAGVWVEFEQGNPEFPIWVGCYWSPDPPVPPGQAGIMAQTATRLNPGSPLVTIEVPGAGIGVSALPVTMASAPGMVTLFVGPATAITLAPNGITMTAPTVSITAPQIGMTGSVAVTGTFSVNGANLMAT
jgi:hypothetical protein